MPTKPKRPCSYPSCLELTNGRYCSAVDITNFIKDCIKQNDLHRFYTWSEWLKLRGEVLDDDKHECQMCKAKGKYKKATHVHHVNYLRLHPELALSKFYKDDEGNIKRNLISACKNCHETVCHPERLRWDIKEPLTKERW